MADPIAVLFVEDDSHARASTAEILARHGFAMLVASDAEEALRLLENRKIDLLFTDIVMPGMDGVELARRAKQLQPDVKILFMTGYYSRAAEAARLGRLIFKPVREAQLEQAIRSLIAGS